MRDVNKAGVYEKALQRVKIGNELRRELMLICPDAQQDPQGARGNIAARRALSTAMEIIRHSPPVIMEGPALSGHWAGMIDAACRLISAVELEMYDPREHPDRYK